jgi:uncharacterized repeat protein (TIGR01451 family)
MKYHVPGPRLSAFILILALGLLLPALARPTLAAETFQNPASIAFTGTGSGGPAALYPSPISVAGLNGSITRVTVTLTDIANSFPDNMDLLLVGPGGQQVLLLSDAGGNTPMPAGGVSLTFADGAAAVPDNGPLSTTATYRPTNYNGTVTDDFPTPGPGRPDGNALLSVYNLSDPNGEWRLFATEDGSGSSGSIGAWSLTIETADLVAEVSDIPPAIDAGSQMNYSVTVRNRGTEPVADPTVTIGIPAGTSFVSAAAPAGWSCAAPAAGATSFTCTVASFASGSVPEASPTIGVTALVDKALAPGTTITRTASISSAVPEADTANNQSSKATVVTTRADLEVVTVDGAPTVHAGDELTIAVTARNNGPSNAANARLTIPVPASTTFVAVSGPEGWSCGPQPADAPVAALCTMDVFTTESASFTLRVKTDAALANGASIESSASIESDTLDGAAANNEAVDITLVDTSTDLTVAISDAPDPVSSAAELAYTIAVTNNGPSNAAAARMTTSVAPGTTFVSLQAPAGWTCSTPAVGDIGAVICDNSSFGVTSESFLLTVRVLSGTPPGTTLALAAAVQTSTAEIDGSNDADTETTTVTVAADLAVTLDGVGPALKANTPLSYNIKVNNGGPEPAEGVTLTATVPANTTFTSLQAPAGWTCTTPTVGAAGEISCSAEVLDVTTETLVLTVQLGDVPNGTMVALTASVAGATDQNEANNTATLSSVVADAADISVTVGGPTADARPGQTLSYTLQVSNAGPESARAVQLTAETPANTTFVSLQAPAGWTCTTPAAGGTGAIACASDAFGVTSAAFPLVLQAADATENAIIVLAATVSAESEDPAIENNSDSLTTPLVVKYQLSLPMVRR